MNTSSNQASASRTSTGAALRLPAEPGDLLNYRLARLLALAGAPVIRLCEGRYRITRREFRLLGLVVQNGSMSPTRLSELAHLDLARTSRVIASLVRKRLVLRKVRAEDRRFAMITATDEGQRLHRELFPQVAEINRNMIAILDPDQSRMLDDMLSILTRHAEAMNTQLVLDAHANRGRRHHAHPTDDEDALEA